MVTLSWAQSLTGAIAGADGARTALSCPESLALTHLLRASHAAILVGIGTVLSDDPLLNVRHAEGPSPQPLVLDTRLRTPPPARLLSRTDRKPWIFYSEAPRESVEALARAGARLIRVGEAGGSLDFAEVLRAVGAEGIGSVMVEGGARVLRSFMSRGLAHQAVITVSPLRIEGARVIEAPHGEGRLPDFAESASERFGRDTVTWGRFAR